MNLPQAAAHEPPYLHGLNPVQREAVEAMDGPVLVLAGAGTGKTRVLTTRLAHIVNTRRAFPSQILAVTFTNKAAHEMRHRVAHALGAPAEGWWLGTFHALAARMLRRHAELVGLTSNFTIIDPDDQARLFKALMEDERIDTKKWTPRACVGQIDKWKDKAMTPVDAAAEGPSDFAGGRMAALYGRYQQRLKQVNACDFGDLLLHMIGIFRDPAHADVLADYHRRFRYILVDEYQDTNVAQYLWLRLLAKRRRPPERSEGSRLPQGDPSALPQDDNEGGDRPNICCVGDDDQSIYGWRGAEVGNILRFEKDFPGAKIVRLEQNYRSTGHILAAASGVIAHNEGRLGKTLWSEGEPGEKIAVRGLWDGPAEARWVGEEIEALQHKGFGLNQIAILVRAGYQTREFEERFIQLGLQYRVLGGLRFYERQEIRDALAYFRVVSQPADDLALERIINVPKRGIGDTTVQTLYNHARVRGISLYDAIVQLTDTDELRGPARNSLKKLVADFTKWREMAKTLPHTQLAGILLDEAGYIAMWQTDKSPEAPGRIENIKELITGMAEFESMTEFLEHVSLVMENTDKQGGEAVTIMTLHGAKGLEFDAVFLPGWEEGLFPSQRSMDENGLKGLEEERRLAYVGITRARKRAYISYAANRRVFGNWTSSIPSRFVDELPAECIEAEADPGLYGPGRSNHWDSSGFNPGFNPSPQFPSMTRRTREIPRSDFKIGTRVFHDKFGYGRVINVDGHKLDIEFELGGAKRVMDSFVAAAE